MPNVTQKRVSPASNHKYSAEIEKMSYPGPGASVTKSLYLADAKFPLTRTNYLKLAILNASAILNVYQRREKVEESFSDQVT